MGSILTFAVLVGVGRGLLRQPTATPLSIPLGTPPATPQADAALAPTASPTILKDVSTPGEGTFPALGIQLTLPAGYRVAETLNAFVGSRTGGNPRAVITKAPRVREEEYVALLREFYSSQAATEAPELLPGQTITMSLITDVSEQTFAARFTKATTQIQTTSGLSGTRYGKVEGISTYDATYVTLRDGNILAVTMAYGVDEPQFDEAAYSAVIQGIQLLETS